MKLKTEKETAHGQAEGRVSPPPWSEVLDDQGHTRPNYGPLLDRLDGLPRPELRLLDQRMQAAMRELGVTFELNKGKAFGQKPWSCDVLPHVFSGEEWAHVTRGLRQRMKAFEHFLHDIYDKQEILRSGTIPIPPVLGSPHFQRPAVGLEPTRGRYLHLGGLCLKKDSDGRLQVSSQHFGHATGVAYMVQNRRVLARVAPETFSDLSVASIAETPTAILEALRDTADLSFGEPLIVMLTAGPGNPFYTEHSFLARRMGVPLVQGGDLLVLDDQVYLKTIGGLERVHVIYNRVTDHLLDPMVLERGSTLGVPGLVHCLRKKTVSLVNSLGSQLADDRALLPYAARIIRFYLGEAPAPADDPDVLVRRSRPMRARVEQPVGVPRAAAHRRAALRQPARPRAQPARGNHAAPRDQENPRAVRRATHLPGRADAVFRGRPQGRAPPGPARLRAEQGATASRSFPGALTRIAPEGSLFTAAGLGGGSKDSWVLSADAESDHAAIPPAQRSREVYLPSRRVTSRVAELFYWMGRYLERANNLAYLVQVVETLELEELNSTERKLYRPMWNKLLPHLEGSGRRSHRHALRPLPARPPARRAGRAHQRPAPRAQQRRCHPGRAQPGGLVSPLSGLRTAFARQKFPG